MRLCSLIVTGLAVFALAACDEYQGLTPDPAKLHYPLGVAVHPDGRFVYVLSTNFDGKYRIDEGGTVSVIDTQSGTIKEGPTVRVASFGGQLQFSRPTADGPGQLVATTRGDDALNLLEVSASGDRVWCDGDSSFGALYDLVAAAAPTALTSALGLPPASADDTGANCLVSGLAASPFAVTALRSEWSRPLAGDRWTHWDWWGVGSLAGAVSVIGVPNGDVAKATTVSTTGVAAGTAALVRVGDQLVAAGRYGNQLSVISAAQDGSGAPVALQTTRSITLPFSTTSGAMESRGLAYSEQLGRLFVSINQPTGIATVEVGSDADGGATLAFSGHLPLLGLPTAIALRETADRSLLFVLLQSRDELVVLDAATGQTLSRLLVGNAPSAMAFSPDGASLYISLFGDDALAVVKLDPADPSVVTLDATIR